MKIIYIIYLKKNVENFSELHMLTNLICFFFLYYKNIYYIYNILKN